MKKLIFALIMMLPLLGKAQAHLGSTLVDIKALHPDKEFTVKYTDDGQKYAFADMVYGTFFYYFDKETGLSNVCYQVPFNMNTLNGQVEAYNKKYVIVSETSWKAYLEGGGLMKINLTYVEDLKNYIFSYTN
ncbi:MAG: hypothetical protein IPM71_16470 [Bacteroidota bacterium]|nr:MAG: hypothetical protein IPM71_16470 [Bacteroidota bacterium]